jgi:hypothetical protein
MNTSTLVVVPYRPVKEIPDYRQQFYTFVNDLQERIQRVVDSSIYPNIRIVVIDSLGSVIQSTEDSKPSDEQLRDQKVPYGALMNSAYFIAKHSSTPSQRILFHEPFLMPNRNLIQLYFEYAGVQSGCTHYTSVYRELFPRNYPFMGVFAIDTDLFGLSNGFPNNLCDIVQIYERFQRRIRRFTAINIVHTNDIDRTSLYYHLFYEDTLGELRVMPKKDMRDAYINWTDRTYSVLEDEFSGIHQMPFFETHNTASLRQNDLGEQIDITQYTIRPTPILSLYNDFPHHFDTETMTEYYGFMTKLMDYIVNRLRQTYALPATIDKEIRQSSNKKDEIIRIILTDADTEDEMSTLYGFRIIAQVIEEAKKWIEEFYRAVAEKQELSRFDFLSPIIENITYYMIPMVHPDHPNEIQISISSYNYLYNKKSDHQKQQALRHTIYKKWMDSLVHAQDALKGIPTINHMPLIYVPSLRLHTDEYVSQIIEENLEEQEIHVLEDNIEEIPLDLEEGEQEESTDVKNIRIPSGSLKHHATADYDDVLDDVDEYDISI